jgi:CRP/FNR family nitrogen fixation transcriptional regulator
MLKQNLTTATAFAPTGVPATLAPVRRASRPLDAAFDMLGAPVTFERNVEIYGEEEPAEYLYQVVSGAVRTYKVLQDGRRQIGAFHLPGDVFGLEAGEEHSFSAEAIARSVIRVAKRSGIVAMAARDSDLAADIFAHTAGGLRLAQEHMLLLGRRNAEERVATFLLDMARREASDRIIELPMSRQDMADYLGLTIETVSRTLTQFESKEFIDLPTSRRIVLRSRGSLQRLNA